MNDTDRGKQKKSEKTCFSAVLFATNPTGTDLGVNLRGERSATNTLNYALSHFIYILR